MAYRLEMIFSPLERHDDDDDDGKMITKLAMLIAASDDDDAACNFLIIIAYISIYSEKWRKLLIPSIIFQRKNMLCFLNNDEEDSDDEHKIRDTQNVAEKLIKNKYAIFSNFHQFACTQLAIFCCLSFSVLISSQVKAVITCVVVAVVVCQHNTQKTFFSCSAQLKDQKVFFYERSSQNCKISQ